MNSPLNYQSEQRKHISLGSNQQLDKNQLTMSMQSNTNKGIPPSGSKKIQANHKIKPVTESKVKGLKIKSEIIDFYPGVDVH